MAYIGKNPTTGSFIYADDITTSSTNTYNILVGGVAFSPESANHCIVSLNGVIQKANTSFSISGSQITFLPSSGTLSSSDSIDFILILGSVNDVGVATTVSDQAITKTKTNFVSSGSGYTGTGLDIKGDGSANGRLGLLCSAGSHGVALESPDHSSAQSYTIQLPSNSPTADKVIKVTSLTGSGATAIAHTQFADAGGTNTPNFFAYVNANQTVNNNTDTKVAFNTETFDTASAYDHSSNFRFTIPSGQGGKYSLTAQILLYDSNGNLQGIRPKIFKNGSLVSEALWDKETGGSKYWYNYSSNINIVLNLSASDYIEIFVRGYTTDSGAFVVNGHSSEIYSYFTGYKIIE